MQNRRSFVFLYNLTTTLDEKSYNCLNITFPWTFKPGKYFDQILVKLSLEVWKPVPIFDLSHAFKLWVACKVLIIPKFQNSLIKNVCLNGAYAGNIGKILVEIKQTQLNIGYILCLKWTSFFRFQILSLLFSV